MNDRTISETLSALQNKVIQNISKSIYPKIKLITCNLFSNLTNFTHTTFSTLNLLRLKHLFRYSNLGLFGSKMRHDKENELLLRYEGIKSKLSNINPLLHSIQ